MDRSIQYSQEQLRSFDLYIAAHAALYAVADTMADALGQTGTVIGGALATQTSVPSLSINVTAGRVYQLASADAVAVGAIPQDTTQILQQGMYAGGTLTLSTAGISAGQSRYSLVQAQFQQSDVIPSVDPTGGVLFYYNAANPTQPYQGPNNDFAAQPTVRAGVMILQVINGAAATTGSEVPPTPTSGWVPLYLIDLTNGQTAITNSEILVAGPNAAGPNIPGGYPQAPFLAGLLNSHHGGFAGQAPKINLATETQGMLPSGSLPSGSSIPSGAIIDMGTGTLPAGFLACNGAAVSRTTYATLFATIGTTWGVGDGSTTFNVPNSARRVRVGSGGSSLGLSGGVSTTVGSTGGEEGHVQTSLELASHTHAYTPAVPIWVQQTGPNFPNGGGNTNQANLVISSAGSSNAFNEFPPAMVTLAAIKY